MSIENLETSALSAIKLLRKKKFQQGIPFMINSDMLESKQCFMEFPDGSVKLVEADPDQCDFRIVLEYDRKDSARIRKKLNLI